MTCPNGKTCRSTCLGCRSSKFCTFSPSFHNSFCKSNCHRPRRSSSSFRRLVVLVVSVAIVVVVVSCRTDAVVVDFVAHCAVAIVVDVVFRCVAIVVVSVVIMPSPSRACHCLRMVDGLAEGSAFSWDVLHLHSKLLDLLDYRCHHVASVAVEDKEGDYVL